MDMLRNNINGRNVLTLAWITLALLFAGCTTAAEEENAVQEKPRQAREQGATAFTGTMSWVELEGGFWGIVTTSGGKYLPTNGVPESLKKDGLPVRGTVNVRKGYMTMQMWGTPVEVVTIEPTP